MPQQNRKQHATEPPKKDSISVPISGAEREVLNQLITRYQEAVITRNRKTGESSSANIHVCEIMRAGIAALDGLPPEKLRVVISSLDRRKKGRPRNSDGK